MKQRFTLLGLSAFLLGTMIPATAQTYIPERDSSETSVFEYVTQIPKRNDLFNLNLEMHATFNTFFTGNKLDEAAFRFNHIKLEANGDVNKHLFYWYRQILNEHGETSVPENLPASIEYALIGFRINDRFTITAGKQDAAWGGFEYDINPLEIYEYSDMNEYLDCYFTGITLAWQATASQELRAQVINNRIGTLEETYGLLPEGIEKAKAPLAYSLNWNSSYLDEMVNLRYSFTASQQAKNRWMYMAWAGHNLEAGPVSTYLDVMYTRGALDQLGLLTELAGPSDVEEGTLCAPNTEYLSLVAQLNYRFHPKWNLFVKGMYETASVYKDSEIFESGKYRTAWGYQGGIEFYPMADENLHLFLTGTGRAYSLTERAKALDAVLDNTGRLSVGFIYKLPLF